MYLCFVQAMLRVGLAVGGLFCSLMLMGGELPPEPHDTNRQITDELSKRIENTLRSSDTDFVYSTIRTSMAEAARQGNEHIVFKAHLSMGRAAYRFNNLALALSSIEMAQQMALSRKDWGGLSESFFLKALIFRKLDLNEKMVSAARAAAEYFDDLKSDSIAVEASIALTRILYESGEYQNAYEIALKGLSRFPDQTPVRSRALLYNYLGMLCDQWGVLLPSLKYYQQALDESGKLADSGLMSVAYNNIGLVYKKMKRYDFAIRYLERSQSIDQARGDSVGVAEVCNNLGIIYTSLRMFEKGLQCYNQSFSIIKGISDSSFYSLIYNNLGDLYLAMGNYSLALELAQKSVAIDRALLSEAELATSLQTRGKVFVHLRRYDEALADYLEAEVICRRNSLLGELISLYSELADLYRLMGEPAKAFGLLRKSIQMNDSVFNEQLMNQSLYIILDRELVEKQDEINKLKAERQSEVVVLAEKNELIRRKTGFQHSLMLAMAVTAVILVFMVRLHKKYRIANMKLRLQNIDMEHQKAKLIQAIEKGKEADRLKENFLTSMNHELRTPLNGIIGFAEIIENESTDDVLADMARAINQSGSRLMTTLNGLLNLSQIERNMVEVTWSVFSVNEMVDGIASKFKSQAEQKSLQLNISLPEKPIRVSSDEVLVARVIENLLDNAIKFTNQGSVSLAVKGVNTPAGYRMILDVADTGIGIDADHLETVFHQFRQVSEGLVRDFEGTGVGLSLCRSYLILLGGDLKVVSTPGQGSVFSILLPALWEEADKSVLKFNRAIQNQDDEPASESIPMVLLVEDDDINREFAAYTLSGICELMAATTAQMALDLVDNHHYKAILLDINLGRGLSGLDVLHQIRKKQGYEQVPVAAVTANTQRGDKERLLAGGFNHYLPKPYSRKELIALLDKMLNQSI